MKNDLSILQEAEKIINGDRAQDYGSVKDNFTMIAKGWELIVEAPITPEQVGLMMVWLKVARQINKPKRDNLVDIAGYAGCIEKIGNE